MSASLRDDILKAVHDAGHSTPGRNPLSMDCNFMTPCGWCCKWEKPCDKRMGGGNDVEPRKKKDKTLEMIKEGKGLPPLGNSDKGIW